MPIRRRIPRPARDRRRPAGLARGATPAMSPQAARESPGAATLTGRSERPAGSEHFEPVTWLEIEEEA